jgi:predicted DNA-binding protein
MGGKDAMEKAITLHLDPDLVQRAEDFSKRTGKSLSQVVSEFLRRLPEPLPEAVAASAPITKSLRGVLRGSGVSEDDFRRHLEEKYL